MLVSVIVITKDEAPRLRLSLLSLLRDDPADGFEIVVVDDGSSDATGAVLRELSPCRALSWIRHDQPRGRSAARNAGARVARGEVLLFLDGDAVAAPDLCALHAARHETAGVLGRGETWHLRCTRFFRDPELGVPFPEAAGHVARLTGDLSPYLVTRGQLKDDFAAIERRGAPGLYPGSGPRELYELEMAALREQAWPNVLWMAASGQNFSVRRADFETVGGFDERLTINEHRELAMRLCERGNRVVEVPRARTYHLTHRIGWRDPTDEPAWERIFHDAHPGPVTTLMSIFWLSLAKDPLIPAHARILSLADMGRILQDGSDVDYGAIRRSHPRLGPLGDP
jgi:glycosyltransferase involved in cell wall biosynthesis